VLVGGGKGKESRGKQRRGEVKLSVCSKMRAGLSIHRVAPLAWNPCMLLALPVPVPVPVQVTDILVYSQGDMVCSGRKSLEGANSGIYYTAT
jgi:hypothetical protein